MALFKCPECNLQVSDKALSCPHCGYPISNTSLTKPRRTSTKRKRLPNGFGSITEVKGKNLRKPFLARVTVGKDRYGKPILKSLKPDAYFKTYNEAYEALVDYNRNPYDLEDDITVEQLYERWTDVYFNQISESATRSITSSWTYCSSVKNMRAKDLRARHIKGCMEDGFRIIDKGKHKGEIKKATAGIKSRIKSMFNLMLDYALEFEVVDRNYARTFEVSDTILGEKEAQKRSHIIFPPTERDILWENIDKISFVDWILIQCYMGWRPQELAILRLDEVNMDNWYIQGGLKTDAGKQRIVPIHSRIKPLVQRNYELAISLGSEFLLNDPDSTRGKFEITYDKYAHRFERVIGALGLNPEHRPHDPRNTFVTMAKKAKIDEYAIKKIVGHTVRDITESAYTDRDIEWLREDIEKIE